MNMPRSEPQNQPVRWVAVPPAAMKGDGLQPYVAGEITNLFDWAENPDGGSLHLMPYRGRLLVDVVSIDANAVHQPSKPGDEIVLVLNGVLRLTTDASGAVQDFHAGEGVLIPAGWAGLYRVIPGDGPFRELAIVPWDYFQTSAASSGESPRRLDVPTVQGVHELHSGRYTVQAHNAAEPCTWILGVDRDEIHQVRAGRLSLSAHGETASFDAGSVVVLPAGLRADAHTSAGYRALAIRWAE